MTNELKNKILNGEFNIELKRIYLSDEAVNQQITRYTSLMDDFTDLYPNDTDIHFFTAPGRTEICGNHTDHNHGKVLAAGINLDAVAAASKNESDIINIKSKNHQMNTVNIKELTPQKSELGKSNALVRGVCDGFIKRGYKIGGFNAATVSDVLSGSGMSSSAAFEVLVGTILDYLYNDGQVPAEEIAKIAQYAENEFFGKPCGLMDQTACAVGGFITIDFKDPENPVINKVPFDFGSCGHSLCIVDTGADHADLTDAYAAVKGEMQAVASCFDKDFLRDIDYKDFLDNVASVRKLHGDRAVMRAMHFFEDNLRVEKEVEALQNNDFDTFKKCTIDSGNSSFMYNQNISTYSDLSVQPVAVALAITESILKDRGAWRVHGGGFAGTIQAFVPDEMLSEYKTKIEKLLGEGSCYVLTIRPVGGSIVF